MNSRSHLFALLIVIGVAPFAFGQVVDSEPNNSLSTATPFVLDTTLVGQLSADPAQPDYEDWFRFTSPGNGSITLTIQPSSGHSVRLQLWNIADDWEMANVYNASSQPFSLTYPNLKEGSYAIRVSNILGSSGSYELVTQFSRPSRPNGEDPEPNDTPQNARRVQLNASFTGHLGYSNVKATDEQDWMTFEIPTDGWLRIHGIPDTTAAIIFHLWREQETYDNTTFFAQEGHGIYVGQPKTLSLPNLQAGVYYLRMQSSTTYGSYETRIDFAAANPANPADTEPNDQTSDATVLNPIGLHTGHLGFTNGSVTDYIDTYRFETTAGGEMSVMALPDSSMGLGVTLLTSDGLTPLATAGHSIYLGQPVELVVPELAPGTYLLRFACGADQHGTYSFQVTTADSLPMEPLLTGRITNAVNGQPIAGASVTVAGITVLTDSLGAYAFTELPPAPTQVGFVADTTFGEAPLLVGFYSWVRDGYHTMTVRADGYDLFVFNSLLVTEPMQFDLSLSPTLTQADLRIVLNWGAAPRDLDSHIRTPDGYHVYYGNQGDAANAPFTVLDHDDVDSYGPETITLVQRRSGTYQYYIHNYSGESSITTSGAVVRFYDGEGLLTSVEVPTTGDGLYWYVADIDGETGRIDLVNRIQTMEPGAVTTEKALAKAPRTTSVDGWTYAWDFGDGATSDLSAPEHLYTQAGVYSVSLTATLAERTARMIRRDYIHVTAAEPEPIQAVNDTVTVVAGTIVRIDPMANDHLPDTLVVQMGVESAHMNYGMLMMTADQRGFIYASAVNARGTDSLRYVLYYQGGTTSAKIFIHVVEGIVRNQAPVVALPVEISILEDSTLAIPMRKLVFDDHDTAAQLTLHVTSVNPAVRTELSAGKDTLRISALPNWWGTSVLTLTATDLEGGITTDHVTLTFVPVNDAPVAVFLKQSETLTEEGLLVEFTDQSHDAFDPEGAITEWVWDFGDGHTSTQRHPRHTYTTSGTFTVRLSVTDNAGSVSRTETTVVSEFTSVDDHERITEFALRGAYPNPFNPTTVLRIDVPEAGEVMIEVYTSMGQRVATLREALTAGSRSVQVDAIGWSSGVYLYTVRYRNQTAMGKMTLIK